MKGFASDLKDGFLMPSLTVKERAIALYFIFSFCMLFAGDDSPVWLVALAVLNFANAARLTRRIEFQEINEYQED